METVHIPKQEYDQYGPYTTLFDMDGAEHYADFVTTCPPTTTHMRNISSESGSTSSSCTTVDGSLPIPTHPSIQAFKQRAGSPQGFVSLVSESHVSNRRIHRYNPLGVTRGQRSQNIPTRTSRRVVVQSDDEDNDTTPLRKGATEQERIEHKRRLNTLAARRSRRRRADELKELVETVDRLEKDCVKWRTRSVLLHGMLVKNGFNAPPLSD